MFVVAGCCVKMWYRCALSVLELENTLLNSREFCGGLCNGKEFDGNRRPSRLYVRCSP